MTEAVQKGRQGDPAPEDPEVEAMVRKFQKELNAGTVALVLLAVIERSPEPQYGYEIARGLEAGGGEEGSIVKQGTLYPVLRALERSGLLSSTIGPSDSGPPRRYYVITAEGRSTLEAWQRIWDQTRTFVDNVLEGGRRG